MKKHRIFLLSSVLMLFISCSLLSGCDFIINKTTETEPEPEITIIEKFKTVYYVGDTLDVTGGVLKYVNGDSSEVAEITSTMVIGFNTQSPGTKTLYIEYKSVQTTMQYNVIPRDIILNKTYLNLDIDPLLLCFFSENNDALIFTIVPSGQGEQSEYTLEKTFDRDGFIQYNVYDGSISLSNPIGLIYNINSMSFTFRNDSTHTSYIFRS